MNNYEIAQIALEIWKNVEPRNAKRYLDIFDELSTHFNNIQKLKEITEETQFKDFLPLETPVGGSYVSETERYRK